MRAPLIVVVLALCLAGCATQAPLAERSSGGLDRVAVRSDVRADAGAMLPCSFLLEGEVEASEDALGCCEEEEEECFRRHELAVFFGYTAERGEGGATLGVDYSYWLNERFAISGFLDYVAGDFDALAGGVGVWWRPFRRLRDLAVFAGGGFELTNEFHVDGREWETEPLIRIGAFYAFDVGGEVRVGPAFYTDFIGGDKTDYILGITIGKEF